jgi:hypothetical protein
LLAGSETRFVGPVYFFLTKIKYGKTGFFGIISFVKCPAKTLKSTNTYSLLSTVKIMWKTTNG